MSMILNSCSLVIVTEPGHILLNVKNARQSIESDGIRVVNNSYEESIPYAGTPGFSL